MDNHNTTPSGISDMQHIANGRSPHASLLGLPRELRDMILHSHIHKPTNTITMLANFSCHANEISASQPPITQVNHQLRSETLPTFYASNMFTAQLDNEPDLECAKAWLEAIGDRNVGFLRRIAMCGWTRIPFSGMVAKRWVRVVVDLKAGTLETETREGEYGTNDYGIKDGLAKVAKSIEELKGAFRSLVVARGSEPFDARSLGVLMEGFSELCTGY